MRRGVTVGYSESINEATALMVENENYFENTEFSLSTLLNEVVEELLPLATTKFVKINIINHQKMPSTLSSDPMRLKLVLLNIIGNALKFVQDTEIDVFVECKATLSNNIKLLQVTVQESKTIKKDLSLGRQFGEFRLELYQTKRMARVLGGDVVLKFSTPDLGASFVATFLVNDNADNFASALIH